MAWNPLTTLNLTIDWQFTEPVEGSFFRFSHEGAPSGNLYSVAQAEIAPDGSISIYGGEIVTVDRTLSDVIRLPKPGSFTYRRIAIKKLPNPPTLESELKRLFVPGIFKANSTQGQILTKPDWTVTIESSDFIDANLTIDLAPIEAKLDAIDITPIQSKLDEISSKLDNLQASGGSGGGSSASQTTDLSYSSDGDTNGVFYYLGTNRRTASFANPGSNNIVVFSQIDALNENATALRLGDRDPNSIAHTQNTQNAWFSVDLKDKSLIVSRYSLKARADLNDHNPRVWKLQGSQDNVNWTDLDTQSNSILSNAAWYSPPVPNQTITYRYFRLLQTSTNSANLYYFVLAEWELYGKLIG